MHRKRKCYWTIDRSDWKWWSKGKWYDNPPTGALSWNVAHIRRSSKAYKEVMKCPPGSVLTRWSIRKGKRIAIDFVRN